MRKDNKLEYISNIITHRLKIKPIKRIIRVKKIRLWSSSMHRYFRSDWYADGIYNPIMPEIQILESPSCRTIDILLHELAHHYDACKFTAEEGLEHGGTFNMCLNNIKATYKKKFLGR